MKTPMLILTTFDLREVTLDHEEVSHIEEIRGGARVGMKNGATFEGIETPKQIRDAILKTCKIQQGSKT
jgi:hypothetical protein